MSDNSMDQDPADRIAQLEREVAALSDEVAWRRLLFEESRDAIVVLGQDAGVVEANRRFAELLGYADDEVRDLHAWDWDVTLTRDEILALAGEVDMNGHHFETRMRRKDGELIDVDLCNNGVRHGDEKLILCICRDMSERNRADREKGDLIRSLRESTAEVKTLRGILPLCSFCKKVRDDEGFWEQVDIYLAKHSSADISHGLCPDCFAEHYPGEFPEDGGN